MTEEERREHNNKIKIPEKAPTSNWQQVRVVYYRAGARPIRIRNG